MEIVRAADPWTSSARPEPEAVQVLPEADEQGRVAAYHFVVKRSYRFGGDGVLRPAPARPLELADRWLDGGGPSSSAPAAVAELTPPKPRCDVVVMGHCHPPGRQSTDCVCAVTIESARRTTIHRVRIVGDRVAWLPAGQRRARYTSPRPFSVMPLDWNRAWGGRDPFAPGWRVLERNPVGRGYWFDAEPPPAPAAWLARASGVLLPERAPIADRFGPLPNLLPEDGFPGPDALLRTADGIDPAPVGFGWRAAHWASDAEDLRTSTPSYSGGSLNRAPAPLQVPHPGGATRITLLHMRDRVPRLTLQLPVEFPRVHWNAGFGRAAVRVVLDTVLIEPDPGRLDLVWRGTLPMPADRRPPTVMPRLLEVDGVFRRWATPIEAPIPRDVLYGTDDLIEGGS